MKAIVLDPAVASGSADAEVIAAAAKRAGAATRRIVYGTARVEGTEADGGMFVAKVSGSVKVADARTAEVLLTVNRTRSAVASTAAAAVSAALAGLGEDIGQGDREQAALRRIPLRVRPAAPPASSVLNLAARASFLPASISSSASSTSGSTDFWNRPRRRWSFSFSVSDLQAQVGELGLEGGLLRFDLREPCPCLAGQRLLALRGGERHAPGPRRDLLGGPRELRLGLFQRRDEGQHVFGRVLRVEPLDVGVLHVRRLRRKGTTTGQVLRHNLRDHRK